MNRQDTVLQKKHFTIKDKFNFFRDTKYIYLDNAATTQVPTLVINAVRDSLSYRGNPNRSAHQIAKRNEKLIALARENIANFIGAQSQEIIFANNTTDALNTAVESILDKFHKGDEILLSLSEHNSNVLPYWKLREKDVKFKIVKLNNGIIDIDDLKSKLTSKTKLVAVSHCSNVLGSINPVEKVGSILRDYSPDIFYFVDGAQAIAHIPVQVKNIQCTFYAFSGHKAYGPDGIGVLYIDNKIHSIIKPIKAGGGTISELTITYGTDEDILHPEFYSSLQALEGGTPNISNIIGLSKAINFIKSIGIDNIREHEIELIKLLFNELSAHQCIEILGPTNIDEKIGIISFALNNDTNVKEMGEYLSQHNICIRYGAHCAFLILDNLKKETLRISIGVYNDKDDIDTCIETITNFLNLKIKDNKSEDSKVINTLRNIPFYTSTRRIYTSKEMVALIEDNISKPNETDVIVMAGHFLGIPDVQNNTFYPSIKPLVPERLHPLLHDFGMTEFPLFTWETGCEIVALLKKNNISTRLIIIANDTTGINELSLSPCNTVSHKSVKIYRDELIRIFSNSLPSEYQVILEKYNLNVEDLIKYKNLLVFRESILRGHFKNFIRKNKHQLGNAIAYTGTSDKIELHFNILQAQDIKTCNIGSFGSKTGGQFCVATVAEFAAELFGIYDNTLYSYIPENVSIPLMRKEHSILLMLTPSMCNNAVNSSAEAYIKLFSQGKKKGSFQFINIPLGSEPAKNLQAGVDAILVRDKMAG